MKKHKWDIAMPRGTDNDTYHIQNLDT